MSDTDFQREQEAEARVGRQAFLVSALIVLMVWIISSTSILIERDLAGIEAPWLEPWIREGTSPLIIIPLFFLIRWIEKQGPISPSVWKRSLIIHIGGSLVFAAIVIAWMALFRATAWPLLFGRSYDLFNDTPGLVFIYEYRKLLPAYFGPLALIYVFREFEMARLELDAARQEARSTQRLTLKCGGRQIYIEANGFMSAKAAGNYVEVRTPTGEHLARMTLAELEKQLTEASVDAVRVHRSWLVNQAAITEISPTGEGDVTLTLSDGSRIPGSRRYRDRLKAA
ncbi:LytTR family DNA-binding domain-containing protein [Hyphobacterium sp.]|uniref:LytTR family DNA-binding domain-containing protein n=1 Tax=Hyphobacterium sp. TaxID=2004662 RepID=UPI003BA91DA8